MCTDASAQHTHAVTDFNISLPYSSILIGKNEVIKISDFGTSRAWAGEQSTCMSFAGTVAWMAPEVIRNEPCNDKVDIWSFGVCVWELLTCEVIGFQIRLRFLDCYLCRIVL